MTRAYTSLWILVGVMIVTAGGISASVAAPPGAWSAVGFAVSSLLFVAALILAGRVTIALERARRKSLPQAPLTETFPILSRLLRRK